MESERIDETEVESPPRHVLLVSAGASHSVALLSGSVICSWGRGEDGQLGHGDAEDRLLPTVISAFNSSGIVSVACGSDHTIAYSESEQQVYSWGWGDFGRLGHGNSSDLFAPQPIKALQGITIRQIACGDSHCLALTIDGEVQSWGRNQNGQLGLGTTDDSPIPQKIEAFKGIPVKMIAAGAEHTAAVTEDGELYGWGWGRYGNLGLGDRSDRLLPEKVLHQDGQKMVLIACGWRHTITVSSTGSLYTYGWSKYGQLGHGDFNDYLIPHQVEALKDRSISQISGGWRHTMALTSDGHVYCWGWNKFGQVGSGDNVDHCSPQRVKFPNEQKIVQISCGWRHTLAVSEKRNVYSWGRGTNGQLGHGDSSDRISPASIFLRSELQFSPRDSFSSRLTLILPIMPVFPPIRTSTSLRLMAEQPRLDALDEFPSLPSKSGVGPVVVPSDFGIHSLPMLGDLLSGLAKVFGASPPAVGISHVEGSHVSCIGNDFAKIKSVNLLQSSNISLQSLKLDGYSTNADGRLDHDSKSGLQAPSSPLHS